MLDFAIDIARRAGALLLEGYSNQRAVELKSRFNLVTDMDRASEQLIVDAIRAAFPEHAILAEEGGRGAGAEDDSRPIWLIDPLDGTTNYAHGFPLFCVSLALWQDRAPRLGVVYDPLRDELFSAELGGGTRCNGRPITVSATPLLDAALISTGFPYDYAVEQANNLRQFDRIQARCRGVRRGGSAALEIAYVAMGRLDAHWELWLNPWDTGAATLLVLEAGGRLSDCNGDAWHPWKPDLIASNGLIHDELIRVLSAEV
jgi:myo-inositol-1(or 4)-monophosphatase